MTDAAPPARLLVPDGEASAELVVKNSVFVGTVAHAADADQAHERIETVRRRYPDANHHAWAYALTGGPRAVIGSSDDGEPGGTAGRPMLAVLQGHSLEQAVAIGTRFFGGTKLGTGGLVRAYSDCVRLALDQLRIVELVYHQRATIEVDYGVYGALKYQLPRLDVRIEEEVFGEHTSMTLGIRPEALDTVSGLLSDATNGRVVLSQLLQGGYYVKITT